MGKESSFSYQNGAFDGGRGSVDTLNGTIMSGKGAFSCQSGAFAGERGAIYA